MYIIKEYSNFNNPEETGISDEWEIISFRKKEFGDINYIVYVSDDYPASLFLSMSEYEIFSVKRLSDGEIFKIGDFVGIGLGKNFNTKIDRFWISFLQMRIEIGNGSLVLRDFIKKKK